MTSGHHQQTAQILPFRSRRDLATDASGLIGKTEAKAQRLPPAVAFDSWYHQAAIEDASRTRKP
ncbi:DUF2735 domain-containing protein [Methylobacterium sp. Leaf117]|uniref:DUF2735 domain-containing protein n=1 Tax=Methylobacterium sp. Leaf117 TaxID=1736260 RepID=UPI0006F45B63|nr:DUF2735 domain-containing protein [Methylobacterium sp. Leaf117]KQP95436.1 hypothetical protein ASF57_20420 [Methylobacterium sp. Leaf117]